MTIVTEMTCEGCGLVYRQTAVLPNDRPGEVEVTVSGRCPDCRTLKSVTAPLSAWRTLRRLKDREGKQ